MRFLRKLFVITLAFIAALLLVAIFLPSTSTIVRSVEINRTESVVYQRVAELNSRSDWDTMFNKGNDHRAVLAAKSGRKPDSLQSLSKLTGVAASELLVEREISSNVFNRSEETWTFEKTDNGTRVSWTNLIKLNYPMGRIYALLNQNVVARKMEASLNSLKEILESDADQPPKPVRAGENAE